MRLGSVVLPLRAVRQRGCSIMQYARRLRSATHEERLSRRLPSPRFCYERRLGAMKQQAIDISRWPFCCVGRYWLILKVIQHPPCGRFTNFCVVACKVGVDVAEIQPKIFAKSVTRHVFALKGICDFRTHQAIYASIGCQGISLCMKSLKNRRIACRRFFGGKE